jgi:predicted lipoprotein with Yx(FWY)xxD motif
MKRCRYVVLGLSTAAAAALVLAPLAAPSSAAKPRPPAVKVKNRTFGYILQSRNRLPLYYWNREKRAGGRIRCTGACARAWPPLYVKKGVVVPRRIAGFRGTFGTIVRPNGRRQLTYNRLPLYTYAHERPRQVLCDDVDGWFVVRV